MASLREREPGWDRGQAQQRTRPIVDGARCRGKLDLELEEQLKEGEMSEKKRGPALGPRDLVDAVARALGVAGRARGNNGQGDGGEEGGSRPRGVWVWSGKMKAKIEWEEIRG